MIGGLARAAAARARSLRTANTVGRLPPAGVIGCVVVAVGSGFALDLVVQARSTPNWTPVDFFHTFGAARAILSGSPPFRAGYIDLPSLAVLLIPLTLVPKWAADWLFTALTGAAVWGGSALFAETMGWAKPWIVALAVVSSWTCTYGMFVGQPEGLLFADAVAAIALARRGTLFWAGVAAGALVIKPTLTWPIPVFLLLTVWHERRALLAYVRGLALSAGACVALGAWVLPSWFAAAVHFSRGVGRQQTVLSLDGLLRLAPSSWGIELGYSLRAH